MKKTGHRVEFAVAVIGGAAVMGTVGWVLGTAAKAWNGTGLIWGLLFLAGFVVMLFGLVAPLTVVRYVIGRRLQRGGAPTYDAGRISYSLSVGRQWGSAIGYVAIVGFYLALAAVGVFLSGGASHPFDVLVVGDTVAGVSWGAIAGAYGVSRWRQRRARAAEEPRVE